jgi:hypothetical protein
MAHLKLAPQKPPPAVLTHSLSEEHEKTLQQLSQQTSDTIGRTVSKSAIVRALLRYATQQPPAWVSTILIPLIEQEMGAGVVWGVKKNK